MAEWLWQILSGRANLMGSLLSVTVGQTLLPEKPKVPAPWECGKIPAPPSSRAIECLPVGWWPWCFWILLHSLGRLETSEDHDGWGEDGGCIIPPCAPQTKTLSSRHSRKAGPVPLGSSPSNLMGLFLHLGTNLLAPWSPSTPQVACPTYPLLLTHIHYISLLFKTFHQSAHFLSA